MSEPETALSNTDGLIKSIVERVEYVENEIRDRQSDRKEIYAEAKSSGLDVAALKVAVRMRREDADKRAEREANLDLYLKSLGMFR